MILDGSQRLIFSQTIKVYMNYTIRTKDGIVATDDTVKLYDIVQPRVGFWKNKLTIITAVKDIRHIHIRIIETGMDMCFKCNDLNFVNHNNRTAAKSYFALCEKMRTEFIAKYSDIEYIKNHFEDDPLICNDIVAKTICDGAGIYISNNPDKYSALAVNWLANNKELISAIIRFNDDSVVEKLHPSEINDCGLTNYCKLINYFYGKN